MIKRMAALLAVAGLMAAAVPASAGASPAPCMARSGFHVGPLAIPLC